MPKFSKASASNLATCDVRLRQVFERVIEGFDCTILTGYRDQQTQDDAFDSGASQKKWPDSKHNRSPSLAVDAAPYPIDWEDRERFTYFAGYVVGVGAMLGVKLRWGGDWDQDTEVEDNGFDDLLHFEVVE